MIKLHQQLLILLLGCVLCTCSPPKIQWQRSFGGSDVDHAQSVQQTNSSGYIVAGYSESSDRDVPGNHGKLDYWVVKLDASGDTVWTRSLGGSDKDWCHSIQQTRDEGFIVAGYSGSNDGDISRNYGKYDQWVVKLTSSGKIDWTRAYGLARSTVDYAGCIQQTGDGGYIVAGHSSSYDRNVEEIHGNKDGNKDLWIVRFNSSGYKTWARTLGGSNNEIANSIQQTSDRGYIVAGASASKDGDVSGVQGEYYDLWVVKLDRSGHITWTRSLGGSKVDLANSVQETSDGGYIVAGSSASSDGDLSGNHGGSDFWVVKLNSSGDTIWTQVLGGSDHENAHSVQQTNDGGYIVAGYSKSNDGNVSNNNGKGDQWVVKLNSSGEKIWDRSLGGTKTEVAYSIQQTSDGGYILAGESASNDGDVSRNHGGSDFWVVKLEADQ